MYFNRFDIAEAWYLALSHCHAGQTSAGYARLCKLQKYFRPSPLLRVSSLTENGKMIYDNACRTLLYNELSPYYVPED